MPPACLVVRLSLIPLHFRGLVSNPDVLSLRVECQADHRDAGQTEPIHTPTGLGKEMALCLHIYVGKRRLLFSNKYDESFLADKTHCEAVTSKYKHGLFERMIFWNSDLNNLLSEHPGQDSRGKRI